MRGATQAHLVRLRDGSYYVVKFANNPVGARVLVNELVSSLLLGELGIATPEPAVIRVDEDFLREKVVDGGATGKPAVRWIAQMIDHDRAFAGARWRFTQTPPRALCGQRILHVRRPSIREFAPWIARLMALPDQVFDGILQYVPAEWIRGEERKVRERIARWRARRNRVPALLAEALTIANNRLEA